TWDTTLRSAAKRSRLLCCVEARHGQRRGRSGSFRRPRQSSVLLSPGQYGSRLLFNERRPVYRLPSSLHQQTQSRVLLLGMVKAKGSNSRLENVAAPGLEDAGDI
ncbi:hypothetical protein, partial [Polymorphobacter multimanifer]|uniref:hypothetical protein n=1 Tax=Polymorphobacter multimanifer TaxID=1070431 RepID=UPI001A9C92B5